MIANNIIKSALRKLLVIPSGGTPTTNQYADGLEALNDIVKTWSGSSDMVYQDTREEISLNTGEQEFTLGSTGDYVTGQPMQVYNASIRKDTTEHPLLFADRNTYETFSDKTHVGRPTYLYFRNTHPNSTLYFDVTTDEAWTLILTSIKKLTQFPDGTTDIALPDYYETALKHALTIELAPEFGAAKRVTPLMAQMAADSKSVVIGKAVKINTSRTELTHMQGYSVNGYGQFGYGFNQDGNV